jgi:hypothetical protein
MIIHSGLLRRRRRRRVADTGSISVEMATLVLPIAVVMALFAVFCFRLAATRLDLNATAAAAARAASIAQTPAGARAAARQAAETNLAGRRLTCQPLAVSVDTSQFRRGGSVVATISCTVSTAHLTGLGLRGNLTATSSARAVVDTWRTAVAGAS